MADFESRLDRLETAQGIGAHGVVILFLVETTSGKIPSGKILALRRWLGLSDDYPLEVKIVMSQFCLVASRQIPKRSSVLF